MPVLPEYGQFNGGGERLSPRNTHFLLYNTGYLMYNAC